MIDIPGRKEVCLRFKEGGGRVAAVMPIHYPRELLRAFGILPMEVWGPPGMDISHSAAHLQPYVCSMVHNMLSFLKTGGLDCADYIVVPHACDSLQGLGSLLVDFIRPPQPVFPMYLPRGRRPEDVQFLAREMERMYQWLARLTGRHPSEDELMKSIGMEEKADMALARLYDFRMEVSLSVRDFYRVVRSRQYLPAEEFVSLVERVLDEYSGDSPEGVPVLMSGIVPEPMDVLDEIQNMGGLVAGDDFACCGRRLYPSSVDGDPFFRMAWRILNGPPDVSRGDSIEERFGHLLDRVKSTGARGIIFYTVKFCEPELFDLPDMRRKLKGEGIPSVHVEVDINDPLSHQTITRIGAFLEVLI